MTFCITLIFLIFPMIKFFNNFFSFETNGVYSNEETNNINKVLGGAALVKIDR